jgi:putative oxidoreductase
MSPTIATETGPPKTRRTAAHIALWGLQILTALMFLGAGSSKLLGNAQMVDLFEVIGFGQWFRYLTGGLEVIGAVLIVVPRTAAGAALLLACIMVGAAITHVVLQTSPIVPLALLVVTVLVAWGRRP